MRVSVITHQQLSTETCWCTWRCRTRCRWARGAGQAVTRPPGSSLYLPSDPLHSMYRHVYMYHEHVDVYACTSRVCWELCVGNDRCNLCVHVSKWPCGLLTSLKANSRFNWPMLGLRSANAFKMVRLSAPFRLKHVDTNFLIWPSAGTLTRAWRRRRIGVLRGIHPVARSLLFRVLQHSSASAPSANLYQVCGVSTNGSLSSCHSLFVRGVVNKFVALVRRLTFCFFLSVCYSWKLHMRHPGWGLPGAKRYL